MKNITKLLILGVISLGILSFASSIIPLDDFLRFLEKKTNQFNEIKPREFVYLMNDKPFYKPGESIWFGAWVTNGNNLKASEQSQKLYVELVNPKGKVSKMLNVPIEQGRSNGDFELGANEPGGIYKIRAYTHYMKNFGKQHFFEKEITVQKVVMPRLLMKLDFQKKAYGANDLVKADFSVNDLENKPVAKQNCQGSIFLNGELLKKIQIETDEEGKVVVEFRLPENLLTNDGLLSVQLSYNGEKESISRSIPIILNKISLKFHPEGGEIIAGVKNKVGFKALNEFDKPADFDAVLLDATGNEITKFSSYYQGFGAFEFVPEKGKEYLVKIIKPVGIAQNYSLPQISENKMALRITKEPEGKLKLNWKSENTDSVYLVASVRDVIQYKKKVPCSKGINTKSLKTKNWPFGIAKISLFNKDRIVESERLVYTGSRIPLKVSVETDKEKYLPGEEVNLKITAENTQSKGVKARLALSVVDNKLFTFADDKQDNILSYLLMNNELVENIDEPLHYFNKDKQKAWEALDYVLLCSSLKRLSWIEIIENTPVVHFFPEQPGMISGKVINKKTRKGVEATVWLGEVQGTIANSGRSAHVKTSTGGYFTFFNVNPNAVIHLYAKSKKVGGENLQILTAEELKTSNNDFTEYVKDLKDVKEKTIINKAKNNNQKTKKKRVVNQLKNKQVHKAKEVAAKPNKANMGIGGLAMEAEDVGLEECVIVGYGVQKKAMITGAICAVEADEIFNQDILGALNGKVAGVQIINQNIGAADNIKIRIRGAATLNNNENPLYVIDGVPVILGQNQDKDPFTFLNPSDISSIEVFKGAQAQSIYGTRASNGAIIIYTKNKNTNSYQVKKRHVKCPYTSKIVYPVKVNFSKRRRFDAYLQSMQNLSGRTDFRTTLFWEPFVETDHDGVARISFKNSDEVSSFKINVEGISDKGEPGRTEITYHTSLPVFVAAKMPEFVCFADEVNIPLLISNNTKQNLTGELKIQQSKELIPLGGFPSKIEINGEEKKVVNLKYRVANIAGKGSISIQFVNNVYSDEIKREFDVVEVGFPVLESFSSQDTDKEFEFDVYDVLDGSLQVQLTAYPNVVSDIFSGVEGLLREPYGCFEQTSVSSYPNLLVMDYLKTTESKDKQVLAKAESLLRKGYNRLTSFETNTKGYEWFGGSPGHEALTAYGLMQFNDMKSVSNYVDNDMIFRTANWLMDRRDGAGEFKRNSRALDTYGRADKDITNAYIVYALAEAGYRDIKKEFTKSCAQALESKDPYMYAMMANASIDLNNKEIQKQMTDLLYKSQKADGSWQGTRHSITMSSGKSLIVETTSIAVLALMESEQPKVGSINAAIKYLVSARSGYGTFGSTQATILALKAITAYAKFSKQTDEAGTIEIYVGGKKVAQARYEKGEKRAIVMDGLQDFVKEGKNKMRIRFVGCEKALPYSLAVNWSTKTPQSNKKCKLKLDCKLQAETISVSDVVRMNVKLSNATKKGLPMSMIKIGIPGGLSPQPWQLKELRDKKQIDFYEIFDNYLVFYFRQMKPQEVKNINLDLKADMAGEYEGAASCAYLYYTDEDKDWQKGLRVKINE